MDASGAVVEGASAMLCDERKDSTLSPPRTPTGAICSDPSRPDCTTVSAEAKGFAKTSSTASKVNVNVNENATRNLTLKVGAASQTIEVGAQAQSIPTEYAVTVTSENASGFQAQLADAAYHVI